MYKIIKLQVKKERERNNELKVFKLEGNLITKRFNDIIHIEDEDDDFYLNSFSIYADYKKENRRFCFGIYFS